MHGRYIKHRSRLPQLRFLAWVREHSISVEELADCLGVSQRLSGQWFNGTRPLPIWIYAIMDSVDIMGKRAWLSGARVPRGSQRGKHNKARQCGCCGTFSLVCTKCKPHKALVSPDLEHGDGI